MKYVLSLLTITLFAITPNYFFDLKKMTLQTKPNFRMLEVGIKLGEIDFLKMMTLKGLSSHPGLVFQKFEPKYILLTVFQPDSFLHERFVELLMQEKEVDIRTTPYFYQNKPMRVIEISPTKAYDDSIPLGAVVLRNLFQVEKERILGSDIFKKANDEAYYSDCLSKVNCQ